MSLCNPVSDWRGDGAHGVAGFWPSTEGVDRHRSKAARGAGTEHEAADWFKGFRGVRYSSQKVRQGVGQALKLLDKSLDAGNLAGKQRP